MNTVYILQKWSPGKRKTERPFPTLAAAATVMRGEYFDELSDEGHAARAVSGEHAFILSEGRMALIRWNKRYQYKWNILTKETT